MTNQLNMFDHEDLPLFSGTPQRAQVDPFAPQPSVVQGKMFCPWCHDSGITTHDKRKEIRFCSCAAGAQAFSEWFPIPSKKG